MYKITLYGDGKSWDEYYDEIPPWLERSYNVCPEVVLKGDSDETLYVLLFETEEQQ